MCIYISGWVKQTNWDLIVYRHFHSSLDLTDVFPTWWNRLTSQLQQYGCKSVHQAVASSQPASTCGCRIYPESVSARDGKMEVAVVGDSRAGACVRSVCLSVYERWTSSVSTKSRIWRVHNWCFGEWIMLPSRSFSRQLRQQDTFNRLSTIHNRQYTHLRC